MNNPMCDGSGPCDPGQVRLLPVSSNQDNGNIILCRTCYERELSWRRVRNRELAADRQFALPAWSTLALYEGVGV